MALHGIMMPLSYLTVSKACWGAGGEIVLQQCPTQGDHDATTTIVSSTLPMTAQKNVKIGAGKSQPHENQQKILHWVHLWHYLSKTPESLFLCAWQERMAWLLALCKLLSLVKLLTQSEAGRQKTWLLIVSVTKSLTGEFSQSRVKHTQHLRS